MENQVWKFLLSTLLIYNNYKVTKITYIFYRYIFFEFIVHTCNFILHTKVGLGGYCRLVYTGNSVSPLSKPPSKPMSCLRVHIYSTIPLSLSIIFFYYIPFNPLYIMSIMCMFCFCPRLIDGFWCLAWDDLFLFYQKGVFF